MASILRRMDAGGCYSVTRTARTIAATWPVVFAGSRFIDTQWTPVERLSIQAFDRRFAFLPIGHFHKAKAFGTIGFPIDHDLGGADLTETLKGVSKILLGQVIGKVADVNIGGHLKFSACPGL